MQFVGNEVAGASVGTLDGSDINCIFGRVVMGYIALVNDLGSGRGILEGVSVVVGTWLGLFRTLGS